MRNDKDIKFLAKIMDNQFKGPFGFRFGLDGLIGLIPGIGDFITSMASFYIVGRAALEGYPLSVIIRMCLNIAIESLVGIVPLFGNIFDFAWKSNTKNIQLIESFENSPKRTRSSSIFILLFLVGLALTFVIIVLALSIALGVKLGSYIVGHIAI